MGRMALLLPVVAAAAAAGLPASAQVDGAAAGRSIATPPAAGFRLVLGGRPGFGAFGEGGARWAGPFATVVLPDLVLPDRPRLVGISRFTLGEGIRIGRGREGRPVLLSLGPWSREWSDLDGWEKTAVILQTAGGIAAAARFAELLAHRLRR